MDFIFDKDVLQDMQTIISLYKKFDRYKDNTRESLYYHILPSIKLKQYKIHKDKDGNVIAFTNWAFLDKEAEEQFIKTASIEDDKWNSGNKAWHIDTVCVKDIKKVMAWTKNHFKKILKVGEGLNWLRVDNNDNIYRKAIKFKREFHNG